jgi:hypothetical protein
MWYFLNRRGTACMYRTRLGTYRNRWVLIELCGQLPSLLLLLFWTFETPIFIHRLFDSLETMLFASNWIVFICCLQNIIRCFTQFRNVIETRADRLYTLYVICIYVQLLTSVLIFRAVLNEIYRAICKSFMQFTLWILAVIKRPILAPCSVSIRTRPFPDWCSV